MGVTKIPVREFKKTAGNGAVNWLKIFGIESWQEHIVPGNTIELTPSRSLSDYERKQITRVIRNVADRKGLRVSIQTEARRVRVRTTAKA